MKYYVYDSEGNILRVFPSYKQAASYCIAMGRLGDWKIE